MMLNNILNIEGVSLLPKEKQKVIHGGSSNGCGVKIDGFWFPIPDLDGDGATIDDATSALNTNVSYPHPGGSGVWVGGDVEGWCCDSCPWNSVQ